MARNESWNDATELLQSDRLQSEQQPVAIRITPREWVTLAPLASTSETPPLELLLLDPSRELLHTIPSGASLDHCLLAPGRTKLSRVTGSAPAAMWIIPAS